MGRVMRSGKKSGRGGPASSKKLKQKAKSVKSTRSDSSSTIPPSRTRLEELTADSDPHISPAVPVPRKNITTPEKKTPAETGEEVEGTASRATPSQEPQTALSDPSLVLSYYCEMAKLLDRGEWEEFKKVYDSERMLVIQASMHSDVLMNGISLRLQRYREQRLQQDTSESSSHADLSGADLTHAEGNRMDVDDEADDPEEQDKLAIKIVAEAVGEQLHQLLRGKLHAAIQKEAGAAPLNLDTADASTACQEDAGAAEANGEENEEEEEEEGKETYSEQIRSRPPNNSISRAGEPCKLDSKNRVVSRPAVQRDVYSYGGTKRVKWSEEEECALIEGLTKYEGPQWAAILRDPLFAKKLALRKNTDLKDKYMVLRRSGEYDFSKLDKAIAEEQDNISKA